MRKHRTEIISYFYSMFSAENGFLLFLFTITQVMTHSMIIKINAINQPKGVFSSSNIL